MSRTTVATLLNFLVPGAGLWYLGYDGKAIKNFAVAVVLGVIGLGSQREHVLYLFLAVAAGSAGYAHSIARTAGSLPHSDPSQHHHNSQNDGA